MCLIPELLGFGSVTLPFGLLRVLPTVTTRKAHGASTAYSRLIGCLPIGPKVVVPLRVSSPIYLSYQHYCALVVTLSW